MAALPYYTNTTTTTIATGEICGSATTSGQKWYIDTGTGGPFIRVVDTPMVFHPYDKTPTDDTLNIASVVTKEDRKIMKKAVEKYMKKQMLADAKEIAGQLFEDIEELREEKVRLQKDMKTLREQIEEVKENTSKELKIFEEMMEKKAKDIFRFTQLDFSE